MKTILIRLNKLTPNGDNIVKFISTAQSGEVTTRYFFANKKLKISKLFDIFQSNDLYMHKIL